MRVFNRSSALSKVLFLEFLILSFSLEVFPAWSRIASLDHRSFASVRFLVLDAFLFLPLKELSKPHVLKFSFSFLLSLLVDPRQGLLDIWLCMVFEGLLLSDLFKQ